MIKICAEIIGTTVLVLLGNGVAANVILTKKNNNDDKNKGWLTIAIGWSLAVFIGVIISAPYSGAHLNPCVTISLALTGKFSWYLVPFYIISQLIGSILGSILVWILYKDYFSFTKNKKDKLSIFVTIPTVKNFYSNFFSEILSTFIFIFASLFISSKEMFFKEEDYPIVELGVLEYIPTSLLILGIIISLGGITGPAINPTRDLGPRIVHSIFPISGKGDSNWDYAIVPILGPIIGSIIAAKLYLFLS
ncbi:MIP/aquaporin family protein [Blattabacterium cuenoti]|uniref:MIP/aquaporin family protein n=1 Tax=Blattabacterium cuenoti TaxID=1653831 RepID=UPI00163C016D|nr:MIP/aquaporin family protein [Blattabacterium cuenoti]